MSVLTDPAAHGILISELTNCPPTACSTGRVGESLAKAVENMIRTRTDSAGSRLRLNDGERLCPKNWSGSTPLGGFAREVAAWLGFVDPQHETKN